MNIRRSFRLKFHSMVKFACLFDSISFVSEINCTCDNSAKWSRCRSRWSKQKKLQFHWSEGGREKLTQRWSEAEPKLAGGAKGDQELHQSPIFTVAPPKYSNLFKRNKLLFEIIALFPVPSEWTECRVLAHPFKETASGKTESETIWIQSKAFPPLESGCMKSGSKKCRRSND